MLNLVCAGCIIRVESDLMKKVIEKMKKERENEIKKVTDEFEVKKKRDLDKIKKDLEVKKESHFKDLHIDKATQKMKDSLSRGGSRLQTPKLDTANRKTIKFPTDMDNIISTFKGIS